MASATLVPCKGCGSHIQAHESTCPFCQSAQSPRSSLPASRMVRVGVVAGALVGSMMISACAYGCPSLPDGGSACDQPTVTQDAGSTTGDQVSDAGAVSDAGH